jgi:hypothetical protein
MRQTGVLHVTLREANTFQPADDSHQAADGSRPAVIGA